ncbi:MAG: hypothetical protein LC793_15700, partial [Thermomicrobia bacterium]|nr:hypothetical protein [Thermomicrobia bacterium]
MSEQHDMGGEREADTTRPSVKRRGLIAGAAALVAASLLSKANTVNVAASGNGTPVLLGGDSSGSGTYQSATATTWIAISPAATPAFRATNGITYTPDATGDGVQGMTVNFPVGPPAAINSGVFGRNNDLDGVGTWGEAQNGTGAFGDSASGSGVAGNSTSGAGIYGQSGSGYGAAGISSSGNGVYGQSSTSNGVYGLSNGSYGVVGVTTSAGFGGCTGITETAGAAAFVGGTHNASAYAAYFSGTTVVNGNFSVTGTKSAAVPH